MTDHHGVRAGPYPSVNREDLPSLIGRGDDSGRVQDAGKPRSAVNRTVIGNEGDVGAPDGTQDGSIRSRAAYEWCRCTAQVLCRHCHRSDHRCAVSADGLYEICYRVGTGSIRTKTAKDGATYYVHEARVPPTVLPDGSPVRQGGDPGVRKPEAERADDSVLDLVYRDLLDQLGLSEPDRDALRRRGLSDEQIDRGLYRTKPAHACIWEVRDLIDSYGRDVVYGVPGFYLGENHRPSLGCMPGLIVPVRDSRGRIVALKSRPAAGRPGGAKYCYVSSARHGGPGPGNRAHVPIGAAGPAELVRITEGELKADVATALPGTPTIGAPGVSCWRVALEAARGLGARTVRVAMDADWRRKPEVARSILGLCEAALAGGLNLEIEAWDEALGKGIDDILAAGLTPKIVSGEEASLMLEEIRSMCGATRAEVLDDDASAALAFDGATGVSISEADLARLRPEWRDGVAAASADGQDGIDAWLDRLAGSDPDRARACEEAWGRVDVGATPPGGHGYPVLEVGMVVQCHDRPGAPNFGKVARDAGDSALVSFKDGAHTAIIHKKHLRHQDGSPLARPEPTSSDKVGPHYESEPGHIFVTTINSKGDAIREHVADFSAEIVESVVLDDGSAETRRTFRIEARSARAPGVVRSVEIAAEKFDRMDWVTPTLGPEFRIEAGRGMKDHARSAIQSFSGACAEKSTYTHTGWRRFADGWAYLHSVGAIGASGNDPSISVKVEGNGALYRLPDPPEGDALTEAIRASLGLLGLADDARPGSREAVAVLFSAIYRAAIVHANFAIQLHGRTGSLKSSVAALA